MSQALRSQQQRLKLHVIDAQSLAASDPHPLIESLREKIFPWMPTGLYDPQDLEHQTLFRLTTFDPGKITDDVIREVVDEQYSIIRERLDTSTYDIEYMFRGCKNKYADLNCARRLTLVWDGPLLLAKEGGRQFVVEWRKIHDESIISLFTNELHYIHQERTHGETFGLYFQGEEYPWAIETTEPSVIAPDYKRAALLAQGVDPNKGIELTRFYTLPGAPRNAISVFDRLVADFYRQRGIEALYTTTMPMYAKTKGSTVAGGIDQVLLVKPIIHRFAPTIINGRRCYRLVTRRYLEAHPQDGILTPHPDFPLGVAVEYWKRINPPSLPPLAVLAQSGKAIYIHHRPMTIEKEIKLPVTDLVSLFQALRDLGAASGTCFIRDTIFGTASHDRRIRLRIVDSFDRRSVRGEYKYPVLGEHQVKTEVEETIYDGVDLTDAMATIRLQGEFQQQNSYEKVRTTFRIGSVEATVDVYPYGAWLELEGEPSEIWLVAEKLGYTRQDARTQNADELYLEWQKRHGLPELWDVRFGLETTP